MRHETVSPAVQTLLNGRQRIENGWCKVARHVVHPGRVEYCALGATAESVAAVAPADVVLILQRALPKGYRSVVIYNDAPETTKEDILALYDRAIELALGNSRGNSIVDKLKEF